MLLVYLHEYDARLQWRQATVCNDVTVSVRQILRKYDSNMVVCVHCIRPVLICLEASLKSNGIQRIKKRTCC